jgi:hypothetical protein
MTRRMADEEGKSVEGELMENTNLPFIDRVMSFPLPDKFKMPQVDKYDGSGDLAEHVKSLRAHFILHGTSNEISCRTFPLTLTGVTEEWFARLPVKSINNFKDLECLFLGQLLATQKRNT